MSFARLTPARAAVGLSLLVSAAHVAVLQGFFPSPFQDDAYISLRYARNLATGAGLVFNPGERVEGFTNPLWTLIAAAALALKLKGTLTLLVLGVACYAGLIVSAGRLGAESSLHPRYRALIPLLTGASTATAYWSLTGMETVPFAWAVLEGLRHALRAARTRSCGDPWMGLCFGVAALLRPEAVGYFGLLLGVLAVHAWRGGARPRPDAALVGCLLAFGALVGAYQVFRLSYYGAWLPNTFYAKVEAHGAFARGLQYVGKGALSGALGFLLVPVFAARRAWARPELFVPASLVAFHLLYVVAVGGDYMKFGRFLIPVLSPAAVLWAAAMDALGVDDTGAWRSPRIRAASLAFIALTFTAGLAPFITGHDELRTVRSVENYRAIGRWIAAWVPPETLVATPAIGAIGYLGHTRILDTLGLVDPWLSHHRDPHVDGADFAAGHARGDADYVLRRQPAIVFFAGVWLAAEPLTPTTILRRLDSLWLSDRLLLRKPEFFQQYEIVNYRFQGGWLGLALRRGSRCHPDHPSYRGPVPALRGRQPGA